MYLNRDIVFYKREGKEIWLGPGNVVFQDGKVVFVRHGNVFVRVSLNRLCKVSPVESNGDGKTQSGHCKYWKGYCSANTEICIF